MATIWERRLIESGVWLSEYGTMYILVKWRGEDACSIVEYKDISNPSASDIVVETDWQVMYKKLHLALVKAI